MGTRTYEHIRLGLVSPANDYRLFLLVRLVSEGKLPLKISLASYNASVPSALPTWRRGWN